jgi:hypothetical protein
VTPADQNYQENKQALKKEKIGVKPLSKAGNPRHSSDVYMHADHSLSYVDISFHIAALDGTEPMNLHKQMR